MSVIPIGLAVPDLRVVRMEPCSALVNVDEYCGATPASMYSRSCGVIEHIREIWLCPIHAALAASGLAICHECAARGGVRTVLLVRLTEPIRIP